MKIEWFVSDLDGTLLDSKTCLGDENINAVRELIASGVGVVLATGRSDLFVKDYIFRLGITLPVISCNGGLVRDVWKNEVLFSRTIPRDTVIKLAEYCFSKKLDTLVYSYDTVYHLTGSNRIGIYFIYNDRVADEFKVPLKEAARPEDLSLDATIKFFVSDVDEQQSLELQELCAADGNLYTVSSMRNVLDIMAKDVSKGEALAFLAKKLGMNLANTAVIGDNHNDVSMLRLAGWPIAVANAEEEVKSVAKTIALSN